MREVKVWKNYRGEYVCDAEELGGHYINFKVKWWVAKIIGIDPKWVFAREFLPKRRVDFSAKRATTVVVDTIKPGDVLEVVGGSWKNEYRAYMVVKDINFERGMLIVEDISTVEARELAEQMGVKSTMQVFDMIVSNLKKW
ncbi:MAG: hypothetical protein ACTSSP_12440 [Candidatus Asgardarchaeia archaeon]